MNHEKTWYAMKAVAGGESARLDIYDEIGGWGVNAGQFATDLKGLGAVAQLDVHIHSPGGSVVDGAAIFNLLKQHAGRKVVTIDGMALSMASVIAMAGDEIIMPGNALMMIHNTRTMTAGDAEQLRKDADLLDKMKAQIAGAYVAKTGKTADEIAALMDAETWMDGKEAVAMGFATRLADWEVKAAAAFDLSGIASKADPRLAAIVEATDGSGKPDGGVATEPLPVLTHSADDVQRARDEGFAAGQLGAISAARAEVEKDIEAIHAGLNQRDETIKAHVAAIATRDAECKRLAAELEATRAECKRLGDQYADAQRKHTAMLAGVAFVPEVTWHDALAKCGKDYAKARKQYPAAYDAFMAGARALK